MLLCKTFLITIVHATDDPVNSLPNTAVTHISDSFNMNSLCRGIFEGKRTVGGRGAGESGGG